MIWTTITFLPQFVDRKMQDFRLWHHSEEKAAWQILFSYSVTCVTHPPSTELYLHNQVSVMVTVTFGTPCSCFEAWFPSLWSGSLLVLIYTGRSTGLGGAGRWCCSSRRATISFADPQLGFFFHSILFPLAFYHSQKTKQPNQFPAAASVQAWFCHPAVINACLTSKAAGEDGVKALTGRVTVICVLTFHVQSSGNRKLLQRGRKKVSTSFIYQSLYIYSILSFPQLGPDLFFFSIFFFLDLLAFISSFVNQLKDFFFIFIFFTRL